MTKIDIDTAKTRAYALDLKEVAKNITSINSELYNDFKKMPENKIWMGVAAENYIKGCLAEKQIHDKHAENMKDLAQAIINYMDALEFGIKGNKIK